MVVLGRAWRAYNHALASHPLITNTATATTLFLAGDVLCQTIEHRNAIKEAQLENKQPPTSIQWNYERMFRMTAFGFVFFGPSSHYWYRWLEKFFSRAKKEARDLPLRDFKSWSEFWQKSKMKLTLKKIAFDEGIYSPACIAALFVMVSAMEGRNWQYIENKFRKQFLEAYKMDLAIWPVAQ
jgi:hypothetical protein